MKEVNPEILRIAKEIREMEIRGAGKIARYAATALKIAAETVEAKEKREFLGKMREVSLMMLKTRPTAVSLPNAIRIVMNKLSRKAEETDHVDELRRTVVEASDRFIRNSIKAIKRISEIGAKRIKPGSTILTHCHSTAAISIMIAAHKKFIRNGQKGIKVVATETRPRKQGLITARMLANNNIPVTLIVDGAIRFFMSDADVVLIGADAIAANGAVVNKIGTSLVALAAHEARVRVYVAAESYKFSPETILGELIEIEERRPEEIVSKKFLRENPLITVRNPAFDVTPPEYIDLIITEKGAFSPQAAPLILKDELGWSIGGAHKYLI